MTQNRKTAGVRPTERPRTTDRRGRADRASYPTSGSAALQVEYAEPAEYGSDFDEPVRVRSAAERAEADRRAAERVANRAAGRADLESRRRLRVAPPLPVTVARAPFVAMLCVVVVAGVVGILVLTAKINANQFRLDNLQSQQAGLNQQEQQLQAAIAVQQAPGNLVAAAKKLGLVPAGTLAYITLPNGKVYGLPQPASKVPSVTAQTGAPATAGAVPSGAASSGATPAGTTPTGTASTGTTPTGTTPTGITPTGTTPTGIASAGTVPTGTAPAGTVPPATKPPATTATTTGKGAAG
jgi:negative regulator of sigma E activity